MTKTQEGLNKLSEEKFQEAFRIFYKVLEQNPLHLEAKMGILLCDIASNDRSKAMGLLEFYYALLLEEKEKNSAQKILDIIQSMDDKSNQDLESLSLSFVEDTESLSCISYEDFKNFVFTKSNFKEAFEDFSLSTKIAFSHKEELYEFLNLLIDKGYAKLSFQYAENISETMGFDLQLNQILQKALKRIK